MQEQPASLTRSTLTLTAVGLAAQMLGFFYRVVLSRMVGAETMGLYQLVMPVYAIFLSLSVNGLTVAVSKLTARYHALGQEDKVSAILALALRGLVLLWAPLAGVVVFFRSFIAGSLLGDGRTVLALVLLLPVLLLTGVENLTKHQFYGMGEVRLPAGVELGEQLVRTAAVLLLVGCTRPQSPEVTVGLIVAGMLVSEVFSSLSLTLLRGRQKREKASPSPLLVRQIGAVALPVCCTALLGNLMASANAVLIPKKLVAAGFSEGDAMSAFGVVFGMTVPMLSLPSAFIGALCLGLVPRLSRCKARREMNQCGVMIGKAITAASVIVLPVTALLATLGPDLGRLLFDHPDVGGHLLPLTIGVVLGSYESVLASALNGIDRQFWSAGVSLLCGGVQLLFTLTGHGLSGFLAGLVAASLLGTALRWGMVRRWTGLKLDVYTALVAPGLSALLTGLCVRLLYRALSGGILVLNVGLCTVAGMGLYALTLSVLGIHPLRLFRLR